jgi:hypothetical protein
MKKYLYYYLLTSILSLAFMTTLMIFVFDKPLIVGWGKTAYDTKYQHFIDDSSNIIIVAGSNGFFSHSCEVLEKDLNKNCINYSVSAGLGLEYILEKSKEVISDNTTVILPLEFGFYYGEKKDSLLSNGGNLHILENDLKYLFSFGYERALYIIFSKDCKYIFGSILENILDFIGFERRFNVSTLNKNGDMKAHTKIKSKVYNEYVSAQLPPRPTLNACQNSYNSQLIADYIKFVNKKGGKVFGSFPTTFDSNLTNIELESFECIKNLYYKSNGYFINLKNKSMYEKYNFYDTTYHLNEETQILHSQKISEYLKNNNF